MLVAQFFGKQPSLLRDLFPFYLLDQHQTESDLTDRHVVDREKWNDAVSLHNNRVVFVRRPCTMADQLSPDEKLNLITRNLQVGQTNKNIQSRRLKSPSSSPHLSLTVCTAGGPWRGEGEAGSPGERAEGVLGHSDHRQAPRRLLRPHVQDRRLPQGRVWGGYVHLSFRKEFRF